MILRVKERIETTGLYEIKSLYPESVVSFSDVTVILVPEHKYLVGFDPDVYYDSDPAVFWISLLDEENNEDVRVKLPRDKIEVTTDFEEQEKILGPETNDWPDPRYNRPEIKK
jgi:hypothetical protein